jgi:hypothetical protein
MIFVNEEFYTKLLGYFYFHLDQTCSVMTLHENLHVFLHISQLIDLCFEQHSREEQNIHFMPSTLSPFTVLEISKHITVYSENHLKYIKYTMWEKCRWS